MIHLEILVTFTITMNQYHFTKGILSLSRTHTRTSSVSVSLSLALSLSLSLSLPLSLYCIHSNKQTNLTCNPLIQFKKSYFKLIKQKQKLQLVTVH